MKLCLSILNALALCLTPTFALALTSERSRIKALPLQELSPLSPGPRIGHAMAYDARRKRTVLFGGFGSDGVPLNDTWEWDGRRWRKVAVGGPSPRKWPAMAYDSQQARMILFGGREGVGRSGPSLNDTWMWDGKIWRKLPHSGPSGRDHHTLVYDSGRRKVVLFGGWDGRSVVGDTWEFDGKGWKETAAKGPDARAAHATTYDGKQGKVVLFGGRALDKFFEDTWTWNGTEWEKQDSYGPVKRAFHGMIYDGVRQRVLLFGGRFGGELFDDTWVWDGKGWERLSAPGPSKRLVYSMSYDWGRRQVVFFGGGHQDQGSDRWYLNDETWIWNGAKWLKAT